jgi:hypothetical protein
MIREAAETAYPESVSLSKSRQTAAASACAALPESDAASTPTDNGAIFTWSGAGAVAVTAAVMSERSAPAAHTAAIPAFRCFSMGNLRCTTVKKLRHVQNNNSNAQACC